MHRIRPISARTPDLLRSVDGGNLNYCGFECPGCGYQHRLSDLIAGAPLVDMFRDDVLAHVIVCPECGVSTAFT
ncbi:MAG TPA: hypothetical protein VJT08_02830, partial [Terriglobales bacterium]|nr:hypothetical protein [Terriglobales bacterium]